MMRLINALEASGGRINGPVYKYVKDVEECCKKADMDQAQKKQKAGTLYYLSQYLDPQKFKTKWRQWSNIQYVPNIISMEQNYTGIAKQSTRLDKTRWSSFTFFLSDNTLINRQQYIYIYNSFSLDLA